MAQTSGLMTTDQVAAYLGVHPETVRAWVRKGQLPIAAKFGNRGGFRFRQSDVDQFLDRRKAR